MSANPRGIEPPPPTEAELAEQRQYERDEQMLALMHSGFLRGGCSPSRPTEPDTAYPANWNPGRKRQ